MVREKRRLSDSSGAASSAGGSKRVRVVASRVDSGLRAGPNRNPPSASASTEAPANQPPRRPLPLKRPAQSVRGGSLGVQQPPAQRRRLTVTATRRPPAAEGAVGGQSAAEEGLDDNARAALLNERRAARQQKWEQRVLGGRALSSACLGVSAAVKASSSAAAARPVPVPTPLVSRKAASPRARAAARARRDAGRPSRGTGASCASGRPGRPTQPRGDGGAGNAVSSVSSSSSAAPSAVDGNDDVFVAPTVSSLAIMGGVRLNRAALRRLEMRRGDAAKTAQTTGGDSERQRRHTLSTASSTASADAGRVRRQTAAGLEQRPTVPRRRNGPAVPSVARNIRRSPVMAAAAKRKSLPKRVSPVGGAKPRTGAASQRQQRLAGISRPKQVVQKRAVAAASAPKTTATTATGLTAGRRTLSSMHRSGSTLGSSSAITHSDRVVVDSALALPEEADSRRLSFSVDDAVVAATPHLRRPSVVDGEGATRPSGDDGVVRATPTRRSRASIPSLRSPAVDIPLQLRLKKWLAKRGKSLSSFRHLQCFHGQTPCSGDASGAAHGPRKSINGGTAGTPSRTARTRSTAPSEHQKTLASFSDATAGDRSTTVRRSVAHDVIHEEEVDEDLGAADVPCPLEIPASQSSDPPAAVEETPGYHESQEDEEEGGVAVRQAEGSDVEAAPLDGAIKELRELQTLGLPGDQLEAWLVRLSTVPGALQRAGYWLCRAAAAEGRGQLDQVLDAFRQASTVSAEPVSELVDGLQSLVERATSADSPVVQRVEAVADGQENAPPPASAATWSPTAAREVSCESPKLSECVATPLRARRTPRKPLLDSANIFRSSTVKYAVLDGGMLLKRLSALRTSLTDGSLCGGPAALDSISGAAPTAIITPVRRSTRLKASEASNPHLFIFDSLNAISEVLRQSAMFRTNAVLKITP